VHERFFNRLSPEELMRKMGRIGGRKSAQTFKNNPKLLKQRNRLIALGRRRSARRAKREARQAANGSQPPSAS
jgi:predicted DNA-binding WGR domain protein